MMRDKGDLEQTLQNKASELFALCDREGKGYATKFDLEALREELPLDPNQLDLVFNTLDADGDGKLTLEEFTDGFGMFLGIHNTPRTRWDSQQIDGNEDDDEMLEELLDHLGARNLFTDEEYLREMWKRVQKEDHVMRSNFEKFISKMAADLKDSVLERNNLQSTLRNRRQDHEVQVQSLYVEMEEQLRLEKENILAKEHRKEQRLRDGLEAELELKDQQLHELLRKHAQMEKQLEELNSGDSEKKHENLKLQKDRDELESRLAASERMLQDMKNQLSLLRKRSLDEKRKRAQAALKVSEGIALERESLVQELHHLKEINKQLLDEKDELTQTAVKMMPTTQIESSNQVHKNNSKKKGLSKERMHHKSKRNSRMVEQKDTQLEAPPRLIHTMSLDRAPSNTHPLMKIDENADNDSCTSGCLTEDCEKTEDFLTDEVQNNLNIPQNKGDSKYNQQISFIGSQNEITDSNSKEQTSKNSGKLSSKEELIDEAATPSRVYKVVFVGDSGVGKTSILQRFCTNTFRSTFSTTVGVDFQVKTVKVDDERIALQLWDTAGQERFRSITTQYFRKADGIIVVYDVTSETSFRNIRTWIDSIKTGTDKGCVIMLLGNKVDLCETDNDRAVRTKDGTQIAEEYGALFYETSAKTGDSIEEAIRSISSVLKLREDEEIDEALKLDDKRKKKKKCC